MAAEAWREAADGVRDESDAALDVLDVLDVLRVVAEVRMTPLTGRSKPFVRGGSPALSASVFRLGAGSGTARILVSAARQYSKVTHMGMAYARILCA